MIYDSKHQSKLVMALVLMTALSVSSCRKYEEGPLISLRSKTKRLANNWDLEELSGNTPLEQIYVEQGYAMSTRLVDYDIEFDFQEDGDFTMEAEYLVEFSYEDDDYGFDYEYTESFRVKINGDWEFSSDKEDIEIDFDPSEYGAYFETFRSRTYKIIKLASDELILESDDGSEWTFEN